MAASPLIKFVVLVGQVRAGRGRGRRRGGGRARKEACVSEGRVRGGVACVRVCGDGLWDCYTLPSPLRHTRKRY